MKKLIFLLVTVFILHSCEWFAIMDTDNDFGFQGVLELKEVLGKDGKPVTEYPVSDFPPFFFRDLIPARPGLQLREIDTLYYLSDGEGTVLRKFAILSGDLKKAKNELTYELENQKYVWTKMLHDMSLLVSQQANSINSAGKTAFRGRYTYCSARPKNWPPGY